MRLLSIDGHDRPGAAVPEGRGCRSPTGRRRRRALLEQAMPLVAERINSSPRPSTCSASSSSTRPRSSGRGRRGEAAHRGRPGGRAGVVRRPRRLSDTWSTAAIQDALQVRLVDEMGLKPRNAFGPVGSRPVAGSRRRCSSRWSCSARPEPSAGCRRRPGLNREGQSMVPDVDPGRGLTYPEIQRGGLRAWRPIVGVVRLGICFRSPSGAGAGSRSRRVRRRRPGRRRQHDAARRPRGPDPAQPGVPQPGSPARSW